MQLRFETTKWFGDLPTCLLLGAVLLWLVGGQAFAQSSLFDSSFANGQGANGPVYSIVVQDEGRVIVGGDFTRISGRARTNLARLNGDGTLDETFPQGTDGAVYRLLAQPDGRVLVGGAFNELQGATRRGIGRIHANGTIDQGFDAGSILGAYSAVFSLAIQPDNKVLMSPVSQSFSNGSPISTVFRLQADGQTDAAFIQTNVFGLNQPWAIIPQPSGSILLGGGFQSVNGISSPGLVVLSTNGERDFSFVSPLNTNSGTSDYSGVYCILSLPDSIFIGGRFWQQGSTNRHAIAKLTATLAWDATFQADAFDPQYDVPNLGVVMSALRQPDGKLVLGGPFQEVGGYWRRGIVRLDSSGRVDPCFDPGLGLSSSTLAATVTCLAFPGAGQILVAGDFINLMAESHNLARLHSQSECNAIRMHVNARNSFVGGTCTPGGTNLLQSSTNLIDWETVTSSTSPLVYAYPPFTLSEQLFFRVKKEY